ncbi:MAG: hypothetical protein KAH68_09750, partial [Draconibacterium sp.]|nr:hypothetical protein [Draconibacterium sp.]
ALTFFSGAFIVPTLAGLLKIKVIKSRVIYAIIIGGLIALSGKLINNFYDEFWGNIIIISSYFFNIVILFVRQKK